MHQWRKSPPSPHIRSVAPYAHIVQWSLGHKCEQRFISCHIYVLTRNDHCIATVYLCDACKVAPSSSAAPSHESSHESATSLPPYGEEIDHSKDMEKQKAEEDTAIAQDRHERGHGGHVDLPLMAPAIRAPFVSTPVVPMRIPPSGLVTPQAVRSTREAFEFKHDESKQAGRQDPVELFAEPAEIGQPNTSLRLLMSAEVCSHKHTHICARQMSSFDECTHMSACRTTSYM